MRRTGVLFVFAMAVALVAGLAFGTSTVLAEPTPGTQVHLPILTWLGNEADACDVVIEVQNVGSTFTKAMIMFWGAPGACPPQCNGPFKIECSGLLKPGATWNFLGPGIPTQVPAGAKTGIVFSLNADQVGGDIFADAVCEAAFADIRSDCDEYRRFKKAFDDEDVWEGFDFGDNPGQPLAVEVVRKCQTESMDAPVVSAYSGLAGPMNGAFDPIFGGFAFYAPLLYADQDGLNSFIYIQNTGLECTSVEIWLKQQGECIRSTIDEIPALAPGEAIQYNVSDLMGPFWQGNAWIRTSVPAGIVVDNFSDEVLMTYHGKPAELNFTFDPNNAFFTAGSQVNYGPLIYREHQGWNTNIQVQNLSSVVNAKVKVYFLDNSGDIIKTIVDWICPRGTQTFPLAVIDGLPGNWVGQARVESQEWWTPGDPKVLPPNIVSVAELIRYDGPAQTVLLEGVTYNLFPEQQAFDWQIGSGNGGLDSGVGLIGIPSFLNNMGGGGETGLTTELAIANLVPKPGFTDFAIYIYDQNGLLDFVCEKLNEKQVEYINVADWNYINDGFKGSAVISATFWEHEVFAGGNFVRNLVGLAAVKVERFNWPLVPSTDPADDAPGDQASASEGFPIIGTAFDFEGPQLPACPGVGEDICKANVIVQVRTKLGLFGTPVAGAVVQLRNGDLPVATGVTDSNGEAVLTNVPVPSPRGPSAAGTIYDIFVQPPGGDKLEKVGRTVTGKFLGVDLGLFCPGDNRFTVRSKPRLFKITGTVFDSSDGDCDPNPTDTRFNGVTVVLVEADGDETEETTDANGGFEFTDVDPVNGPFQLKALIGQVSFPSSSIDLPGNQEVDENNDQVDTFTLNFRTDGDATTPRDGWCDPTAPPGPIKDCVALNLDGLVQECAANRPVLGASVAIFDTGNTSIADVTVDDRGEFRFDLECDGFEGGFREGVYEIWVDQDNDGVVDQPWIPPQNGIDTAFCNACGVELIDTDDDGDIDADDLFAKHNARQINFTGTECVACAPVTFDNVSIQVLVDGEIPGSPGSPVSDVAVGSVVIRNADGTVAATPADIAADGTIFITEDFTVASNEDLGVDIQMILVDGTTISGSVNVPIPCESGVNTPRDLWLVVNSVDSELQLAVVSDTIPGTAGTDAVVVGRVRDDATGEGIAGATVTGLNGVDTATTTTDPFGFYMLEINGDSNATTWVTVEANGFRSETDSVLLPPGDIAILDFQLILVQ